MEEWRSIPGYPRYEASTEGRIRHISHRILKPQLGRRQIDYPRVRFWDSTLKKVRHKMVHILVARAFIGECPQGWEHNHKDGDKRNSRPSNIEFLTPSANQQHRYDQLGNLGPQGSRNGKSKLTETEAIAIRTSYANGSHVRDLSSLFHVSVSTVYQIIARDTWRHC